MNPASSRPAGRAAAVTAAVLLLAGCTSATRAGPVAPTPQPTTAPSTIPQTTAPATPSRAPSTSAAPTLCPAGYVAPDPNRPRVGLAFTIAADHRTVTGTETVRFTPDRPVRELVFRLTANTRSSVAEGNRIEVTSASSVPSGGPFTVTGANAARRTQGGLLRLPLGRQVAAGTTVSARIAFTVVLGEDSFDRFGTARGYAYFGSAQPLLAWERGYGWHTEDLLQFPAESATSEAMDTDLTVTAPAADTVIASGDPADPPRTGSTRTWRSHLDSARDVAVAAGPFRVSDTSVGNVALRVGASSSRRARALSDEFERAITELSRRFGPFPYPSLAVARVPAGGGGIEYPGAVLMLSDERLVAVHETAHEWFYGMVGNSQSQHPWLDEAFATYAQELVDDSPSHRDDLDTEGEVDRSVQSYGSDEGAYYYITYAKGGAALEAARDAAGKRAFDAAIRCYVNKNAWRIANPADLQAQLSKLPKAVRELRKAGAL